MFKGSTGMSRGFVCRLWKEEEAEEEGEEEEEEEEEEQEVVGGVGDSVTLTPHCPYLFQPQQYTSYVSLATATVCHTPHATKDTPTTI